MSALADTLARLRAEKGDQLLERAPAPSAAMIGVGWSIWERCPDGTSYDPRGGIVVHVDPAGAHDPETGEALDRYLVVRAEKGRLQWVSLRSDQVEAVDDGSRPNAYTIRGVCQVAARELASARRTPDDDRDLELWGLGTRLMATLARPGTVAP